MKKTATKKSIKIPNKSKIIQFEKVEAKLVKEKASTKDKIVKPSMDEIAFDKDLRKVLKKYDITVGCFIASVPKGRNKVKRIVSTFNPNQEEENLLLDAMMNLLTKINLTSGDIDAISYLIDQNKK